jgi:predicted nucleic acid-binding protein
VAVTGWIVDNSAAARKNDPMIRAQLAELAGALYICPVGELEQLYSARSAREYDGYLEAIRERFFLIQAPTDIFERALQLQSDLAHHHGLWHRIPIPTSSSPKPRCITNSGSSTSMAISRGSPRYGRWWCDGSAERSRS